MLGITLVRPVLFSQSPPPTRKPNVRFGDALTISKPTQWEQIAPGIQYAEYDFIPHDEQGTSNARVLKINPKSNHLKFNLIKGDRINEKIRLDELSDPHLLAAINTSFFRSCPWEYPGVPVAVLMQDSDVMTGCSRPRATLGITDSGDVKIDRTTMTGTLKVRNKADIKLHSLNQLPMQRNLYINHYPEENYFAKRGAWDETIVFDERWGAKAPPPEENIVEVQVKNNRVACVDDSKALDIPDDGYVIVGPKKSLQALTIGDRVSARYSFDQPGWENVAFAMGGRPLIVRDGHVAYDITKEEYPSHTQLRHHKTRRTAAGITSDGQLLLVVTNRYDYITLLQMAHLMKELGAVNALGFDGGPSSEMRIYGKQLDDKRSRNITVALGIYENESNSGKGRHRLGRLNRSD